MHCRDKSDYWEYHLDFHRWEKRTAPGLNETEKEILTLSIQTEGRQLSDAVKIFCHSWYRKFNISSEKIGQIIFYHETMWDLLDIIEEKGLISMPLILKGKEVGKEHFGDICFIVLNDEKE